MEVFTFPQTSPGLWVHCLPKAAAGGWRLRTSWAQGQLLPLSKLVLAPPCWLWSRPTAWAFWPSLGAVPSLRTGWVITGLCLTPVTASRPELPLTCGSVSRLLLAGVRAPASHTAIASPDSLPPYLEEKPALASPWWCCASPLILKNVTVE